MTIAAVHQNDGGAVLLEFMALRMQGYGLLSRLFKTFGLGWSRRLMNVHAASMSMLGIRAAPDAIKVP